MKATYTLDADIFIPKRSAFHILWASAEITAMLLLAAIPVFQIFTQNGRGERLYSYQDGDNALKHQQNSTSVLNETKSINATQSDGWGEISLEPIEMRSRSSEDLKPGLHVNTDTCKPGTQGKMVTVNVRPITSADSPSDYWTVETDPYAFGSRDLAAIHRKTTTPNTDS